MLVAEPVPDPRIITCDPASAVVPKPAIALTASVSVIASPNVMLPVVAKVVQVKPARLLVLLTVNVVKLVVVAVSEVVALKVVNAPVLGVVLPIGVGDASDNELSLMLLMLSTVASKLLLESRIRTFIATPASTHTLVVSRPDESRMIGLALVTAPPESA